MKANVREIKGQIIYSDDFKKYMATLFKKYKFKNILNHFIRLRIYNFSEYREKLVRIVEIKESSENKLKQL